MTEKIDKLTESLKKELSKAYGDVKGDVKLVQLKDIDGIDISRFSNVTIGKDHVDYQLVNTKDITQEGRVILSDPKMSLRHLGSNKGVKKYQLKKGDIIFPQKRSFRTIGVMAKDSKIPYVGHHGLMRISCGADNLDLAFFLKDYLLLGPIGDVIANYIDNGEKLFDVIGLLPIPVWVHTEIAGYSDTSLNIKYAEKELASLISKIKLLSEKNHTYIDNRDDIKKSSDKLLKTLKMMQKQIDNLLSSK